MAAATRNTFDHRTGAVLFTCVVWSINYRAKPIRKPFRGGCDAKIGRPAHAAAMFGPRPTNQHVLLPPESMNCAIAH